MLEMSERGSGCVQVEDIRRRVSREKVEGVTGNERWWVSLKGKVRL